MQLVRSALAGCPVEAGSCAESLPARGHAQEDGFDPS